MKTCLAPCSLSAAKKRMKLRKGDSARGMGKRGRADEDPSAAREEPRNKSTMRRPEYQIKRQKPSAARVIRATCTGTGLPDDSAEESGRRERPGLYGIRKEREDELNWSERSHSQEIRADCHEIQPQCSRSRPTRQVHYPDILTPH